VIRGRSVGTGCEVFPVWIKQDDKFKGRILPDVTSDIGGEMINGIDGTIKNGWVLSPRFQICK
jgi:hypothetical protein